MLSELRDPKILRRIAELKALGLSDEQIRNAIQEEFKIEASYKTISNIIKTYSVRTKEIIKQDKKFAEIWKEILLDMVDRVKKSLEDLDNTRNLVLGKLNEAKGLDQTKEVKLLEIHAEEIKNTKDWGVVYNKIKKILGILKAPSFTDNYRIITYIREVHNDIRAQNDTIKTMNELLKRLETETKETKISTVQSVQLSLHQLKELEKLGLIVIKKDYYREIENEEDEES